MANAWSTFGLLIVLLLAIVVFALSNMSSTFISCAPCVAPPQCQPLVSLFGITIVPDVACAASASATSTVCSAAAAACAASQLLLQAVLFIISFIIFVVFLAVLVMRLISMSNTPGKRHKKLLAGF